MENSVPIIPPETIVDSCQRLGLGRIQRHLFLCCDQTKSKCCSKEDGLATWDYLKKRLPELGLDCTQASREGNIFRTKANCLRVCQQGPILLVYPEGIWYRNVTPTVMEKILQEHILRNHPVEEYRFFTHALPPL
ncbi:MULTISPECIES: ferredoxin [unclassified Synechocystis]|uniref:(2Fe-2S) ferredoxin domain-containing protein n=1 Tax=unclassified Synechocystis TaxID=2640012 RepID=UPI0003FC2086|nr:MULTISPECIES: ferredoxin [unclassified Synechocystis]AIE73328.1 Ferredoxin, 2Fe-2S [Synechocystis sp. PCC 6714]MCT0253147.1 ferredoxin [Synechocystis sp. CS-94]